MSQSYWGGVNGGYGRRQPDEKKEPEITEDQINKFTTEYDKLCEERRLKDIEIKRERCNTSPMNKAQFEEFVSKMGPCKCDGSLVEKSRRDLRVMNFVSKREKDTNGSEAIRTLEHWAANDLKNPHIERVFVGLFSSPYTVEYRELKGKRYVKVSLEKNGKKTKCMQEFYIREDGI